jgi:hypothetical protein
MKVRIAFFVAVLIACFLMINYQRKSVVVVEQNLILNQNQGEEYHDHSQAVAYRSGYQRGYLSFVKQFQDEFDMSKFMADIDSFDSKVWAYTSNSPKDLEEESKGYVDGYHTAADRAASMLLPRCPR